MQANYVARGEVLDYKNETLANINVGDVVVIGDRIGVAAYDIPVGATGVLNVQGVYDIESEATQMNVGQTVYYNDGKITATSGDVVAGFVVSPKSAASTRVNVKIG